MILLAFCTLLKHPRVHSGSIRGRNLHDVTTPGSEELWRENRYIGWTITQFPGGDLQKGYAYHYETD